MEYSPESEVWALRTKIQELQSKVTCLENCIEFIRTLHKECVFQRGGDEWDGMVALYVRRYRLEQHKLRYYQANPYANS